MESLKFIPFMIKFSLIFLFFDVIFNLKFARFIKSKKLPSWIIKMHILLSVVMLVLAFFHIWIQVVDLNPNKFEKILFTLKDLWYMPKAIIVPVMIISELVILVSRTFKKTSYPIDKFKELTENIKSVYTRITFSFQKVFAKLSGVNLQTPEGIVLESIYESPVDKGAGKAIATENNNLAPETVDNSRRKFFKNATWCMAAVPFYVVSRGILETTYDFKVHEVDLYFDNLPAGLNGLRIAQISDLHAGSFPEIAPVTKAMGLLNEQKADIILFTGDFVNFNPKEFEMIDKGLRSISKHEGVYACLGNHDHFMSDSDLEILKRRVRSTGIDLLTNESRKIKINGSSFILAGNDNTGYGQYFGNFDETLKNAAKDDFTVLMCHDPTNWDPYIKPRNQVDLMLSGHTHGGQMGIEFMNDIITPARILYKQFAGLYQYEKQFLYINRGLGTTGPPLRVGINPEITVFNIKSGTRNTAKLYKPVS